MYDCGPIPSYFGKCCWHSEGAPFVATKHPGYPLRECLQDFIGCWLYIVYMFQWQNQHTLPLVPVWILVPSDPWRWQEKDITLCSFALPSKLCAALHGQSNVGLMCNCKPWGSLNLSVLVEILSGVDNDHGTGPRRNGSVISRSTLCQIERRPCWPKTPL